MIIIERRLTNNTTHCDLPRRGMIVDPRPMRNIWGYAVKETEFTAVVEGMSLIIKRLHGFSDPSRDATILFRVYDEGDEYFPFNNSTKYLYHGLFRETAPVDTLEVVFAQGVTRIATSAFMYCSSLCKTEIPDTVREVGESAFQGCTSLRAIRLPPPLRRIENWTFCDCSSLETLYIPADISYIGEGAFYKCKSLQIVNIPRYAVISAEPSLFFGCDCIKRGTRFTLQDEEVEWLKNRHNPFHDLCWSKSITSQSIRRYIEENQNQEETAIVQDATRMTALHLLAANPFVRGNMMTAYLEIAPSVAIVQNSSGMTPLHVLCSINPCWDGSTVIAILKHDEARASAFVKDAEGRTAFDCLICRRGFEDMKYRAIRTFADLIVWWYEQMGIFLFEYC